MNISKVKFANQVILKLIKTANTLGTIGDQFFKPYKVTSAQFNVLVILKNAQTMLNQQELGALLVVSRSDITGIVDRLEKWGYVNRVPHKNDRRVKLLKILQKGIDLINKVDEAYFVQVDKIIKNYSDEDLKQFEKLIVKMNIWEENNK